MVFGDYLDRGDRRKISTTAYPYEQIEKIISENKELRKVNKELTEKVNELKEYKEEKKNFKEKSEKYLNSLKRVQADYENLKKRIARDTQNYKQRSMERIVRKLISHYDDLKRAEKVIEVIEDDESVRKGFQMILKNFGKLLREEGIEVMESIGKPFDPYKHEAMMVKEDVDAPENVIIDELEQGYYYKNKVLRPAKVIVAK
ncbi:MAG: nucleotide exchange factor GrpE [Candidatus Lokiarchaeota archaeon]|nr:nucleotide exchange factor GrpE [Candidatus Lokiarchaeota archaeon]MBD3201071.1 nucleotide exchange factor GrpE [Candidatus Lokiarchaeota archaeon]